MALPRKKSSGSVTLTRRAVRKPRSGAQFVVCVSNAGYPASLECGKIYRVLRDDEAASEGDLRIVDESGEDYLYPSRHFIRIHLPKKAEHQLLRAS